MIRSMTRARWITSAVTLAALWLLGALVLLPRMQRDLEKAAHQALEQPSALAGRIGRLQLSFDGQRARLMGSVRTPQDRQVIESAVREMVHAPTPLAASLGLRLNPVADVLNEVEVAPYPSGWLLLAAADQRARLLGAAANEFEARDLARNLQEHWSVQGGVVEGLPRIDAEGHDEAEAVSTTLRSVPPPQAEAQIHLARIGGPWQPLALDQTDEALLADAGRLGVSNAEWQQFVLPELKQLRAKSKEQQAAAAEQRRLAQLPPGHLFVAVRDQRVVIRGEVGSEAAKQAVLNEALAVFSSPQVSDEIRVNPRRRPTGDFGAITTALLPPRADATGKLLHLGIADEAWKMVDWQVATEAQPWKKGLPARLDASLLAQDSAAVIGWLQGAASTAPVAPWRPAFISLAVFGSKVVLSGQVAEESVRSQVIAAARRAYAPRRVVLHEDLFLDAACRPSSGSQHTLRSMPAPPSDEGVGIFAIAVPGGDWSLIPVTAALIEAGGLGRSKEVPQGLSATLVEERSAEAIEQLRHWISRPQSPLSLSR